MQAIALLFTVFNVVGEIGATIWLAILGDWLVIAIGLAFAFLGNWLINPAILLGSLLFGMPSIFFEKKGNNALVIILVCLNELYLVILITLWCMGILYLLPVVSKGSAIVPLTLFAYSSATSAWAFLAQKDQQAGKSESTIMVFFIQISLIIVVIIRILFDPQFLVLFIAFLIPMFIYYFVDIALIVSTKKG